MWIRTYKDGFEEVWGAMVPIVETELMSENGEIERKIAEQIHDDGTLEDVYYFPDDMSGDDIEIDGKDYFDKDFIIWFSKNKDSEPSVEEILENMQ